MSKFTAYPKAMKIQSTQLTKYPKVQRQIPPEFRCRCGRHDLRDQIPGPVPHLVAFDPSLLSEERFQSSGTDGPLFVATGDLAKPEPSSQRELAPQEADVILDLFQKRDGVAEIFFPPGQWLISGPHDHWAKIRRRDR